MQRSMFGCSALSGLGSPGTPSSTAREVETDVGAAGGGGRLPGGGSCGDKYDASREICCDDVSDDESVDDESDDGLSESAAISG